jgi:hypothetical protein
LSGACVKFGSIWNLKINVLKLLVKLPFLLVLNIPLFADEINYRAVATFTTVPPRIDGKVDKVWLEAKPQYGFIQREPLEGQAASNDTKFYVLYDREHIYFLFIMLDSEPNSIPARLVDRDYEFYPDDSINFYLDTYNDNRKAFYFCTNPLGIEQDGLISENGDNLDLTWDTIFSVAARRNSYGWIAEFKIPFNSLRFDGGLSEHTWGINVWRIRKKTREISYWALIDQNYQMVRLDKGGILTGLSGIESGHQLKLLPYYTLRVEDKLRLLDSEGNAGLDLKYGLTSDLTFDLTVNPDFGQVEIDEEQINLDKRYEIQLEEKRPFFLENTNLFQTPIYQLFYSRRIGSVSDIKGGAKLTGKMGKYSIGLLGTLTGDWHNYGFGNPNAYATDEIFSVVRIQRDILSSSNVGVTYVDRAADYRGDYPRYNRAGGVDWSVYSGQNYCIGQGVYSYNLETANSRKGGAAYLQAGHYGSLVHLDIHGTYVEPDFDIDSTGFFPKVPGKGTEQAGFYSEIHPFINKAVIRRWGLSVQPTVVRDSDESQTGWGIKTTGWVELKDQSKLKIGFTRYQDVEVDHYYRYFRAQKLPELVYWGRDIFAEINTDEGKPVSLAIRWNYYSQYYFQTHTIGFNRGIESALTLKPATNAFLEVAFQRTLFLNQDGRKMLKENVGQSDIRIFAVRARYLFSKNVFSRAFFQHTNGAEAFIPDTLSGYLGYEVWPRMSGNFLLGWRFLPGSTLYLAYTEVWDKYESDNFISANRVVFLKISYLWSF